MHGELPTSVIRAAGAVLWRRGDGGVEVALIHRPKYDDWSLPKGKLEPGEHVVVAAVREVAEETGYAVRLGRPLPTLHYRKGPFPKEVHYWAAEATEGQFTPGHEVDGLDWLPPETAVGRLTWARDGDVVEALAEAPIDTVPLVLLRHASAVSRSEWSGADDERPLGDDGAAQAGELVGPLRAFGVARLLSSDTARTLDTLRPLASATGASLEPEPLFSDTTFAALPDAALGRAGRLLDIEAPTVVCTHRPVIPWLLSTLLEGSGIDIPTGVLAPGSFWVLHTTGGRVVAVERHDV